MKRKLDKGPVLLGVFVPIIAGVGLFIYSGDAGRDAATFQCAGIACGVVGMVVLALLANKE